MQPGRNFLTSKKQVHSTVSYIATNICYHKTYLTFQKPVWQGYINPPSKKTVKTVFLYILLNTSCVLASLFKLVKLNSQFPQARTNEPVALIVRFPTCNSVLMGHCLHGHCLLNRWSVKSERLYFCCCGHGIARCGRLVAIVSTIVINEEPQSK